MAEKAIAQQLRFNEPSDTLVYWLYDDGCTEPRIDGYIGITCNLKKRLVAHRRSGQIPPGFSITILFTGTRSECLDQERQYRPSPGMGWNRVSGGGAGRRHTKETCERLRVLALGNKYSLGRRHTSEELEKMRIASLGNQYQLGLKRTPESRAKMSAAAMGHKRNFGVPRSAETKAKLSAAMARRSPEVTARAAAKLTGYKHTPEARANMGRSKIGHAVSKETRAKIGMANSISLKGKSASDATKKKMSESAKRSWDSDRRAKMSAHMKIRWSLRKSKDDNHGTD